MEKLTQGQNQLEQVRRFDKNQDDCGKKKCASTEFLQTEKDPLSDLQQSFERYCIVLLVFGFNSAKYDLNLIVFQFLPIPV